MHCVNRCPHSLLKWTAVATGVTHPRAKVLRGALAQAHRITGKNVRNVNTNACWSCTGELRVTRWLLAGASKSMGKYTCTCAGGRKSNVIPFTCSRSEPSSKMGSSAAAVSSSVCILTSRHSFLP